MSSPWETFIFGKEPGILRVYFKGDQVGTIKCREGTTEKDSIDWLCDVHQACEALHAQSPFDPLKYADIWAWQEAVNRGTETS
ncbi:MAG: hypothetical protein WCK39_03100 [Methanomassiliicoccales archaeon]